MDMPAKSLCDSCENAYHMPGGYASIGWQTVEQRYCNALKIAIHFGGKDSCESYRKKVEACPTSPSPS